MTAQSRMMLATIVFLTLASAASGRSQSVPQLSAGDLVKAVINTELNGPNTADLRWRYVLEKEVDGKQETREVVETKSGSLDHLVSLAGKPLSVAQQHDESERVLRLAHSPEEQRKLEQGRRKDAEQCNSFLKMIPNAFVFEYASATDQDDLVKLTFKPNPGFQPPSREGKVLHEMAGEMWIDARQQRLVSINGQLLNEVKFAGGLLGHLEKGGRFMVKRTEIAPGQWEMTEMEVNMRGKALLFKTISVQQKELHRDFERVSDDLTIADAAALLMKQSLVAAKR
jgi:hypothetical protein